MMAEKQLGMPLTNAWTLHRGIRFPANQPFPGSTKQAFFFSIRSKPDVLNCFAPRWASGSVPNAMKGTPRFSKSR